MNKHHRFNWIEERLDRIENIIEMKAVESRWIGGDKPCHSEMKAEPEIIQNVMRYNGVDYF